MNFFSKQPLSFITASIVLGLGIALVLPWIANLQGIAAEPIAGDTPQAGTRYYVAKSGDGSTGQSWAKAFTNLQDALAQVKLDGEGEIWVAQGEYFPDEGSGQSDNDRSSTFELLNDVTIYGGFKSGDSELSDRDWVNNPTILSGDIDGNDTKVGGVVLTPTNIVLNNAYHVVSASNVDSTAVLDGFTITGGKANGSASDNSGGGFYCDGAGNGRECSPTLKNITFSGNTAGLGGAVYNDGSNKGGSSPAFQDVNFSKNSAIFGGAMFNAGYERGTSNPVLTRVDFSKNWVKNGGGGAMYNNGSEYGVSSPVLTGVEFFKNTSIEANGGAMFNNGFPNGASSPSLTKVTFTGNSADNGGAMYNDGHDNGESSPNLTEVEFVDNFTILGGDGGAMANNGSENGTSSPSLKNVQFSGNVAYATEDGLSGCGGAMSNNGSENGTSSPTLEDVTFSKNRATYDGFGGAMCNSAANGSGSTSSPSLTNVNFFENGAFSGGAVGNYANNRGSTRPTFSNVQFVGNSAESGGAVYNLCWDSGSVYPEFTNVVFSGNYGSLGGAVRSFANDATCKPTMTNVTVSGNRAYSGGAAIQSTIEQGGMISTTLRNSIVWNNASTNSLDPSRDVFYNSSAAIIYIEYSAVQGADLTSDPNLIDGGNNVGLNPLFITPLDPLDAPTESGNLRLLSDSPAIDTGNNTFIAEIQTDLDNRLRVVDGDVDGTPTVDMGAFEYHRPHPLSEYLPFIYR